MTEGASGAFVERDDELSTLLAWTGRAAAGEGRVVVVSGEAGIGKTTLVEHYRAAADVAQWWQGSCDSEAGRRLLAPVHDLADDFGARTATALHSGDRTALFGAVLGRLRDAPAPSVLVVEDLHWADDATLDLVVAIGRRVAGMPVLLLLTCRDSPGDLPDAVREALAQLARVPSAARLPLSPLTERGIARLVGADGPDADHLHRVSGGNPFYVTELLRHGDSSPTLRDVALGRLVGLSAEAREGLDLAALAGDRLLRSPRWRQAFLSMDAETALLGRGLLAEEGSGLRFRHEITRLAVVDEIPGRRRTALHRRLLDALSATGATDDAVLAVHAEGAGDREAALRHATLAAQSAVQVGSVREGATHFRRALRAVPPDDVVTAAQLYDGLGNALGLLDDLEGALSARREALARWEVLDDPIALARSLSGGAWVEHATGRTDEAEASARRAVALLEPLGDSVDMAGARAAMARVLGLSNRLGAALDQVREGRRTASAIDHPGLEAELRNIEACCLGLLGQPWEHALASAVRMARRVPDESIVGRAAYNEVCLLVLQRRLDEFEERLPAIIAHAEKHQLGAYVVGMRRAQATALMHLGRWDEAVATANADDGDTEQHPVLELHLVRGTIAARRGEPSAEDELALALSLAQRSGQPQFLVPARVALVEAAWLAGDQARAEKELAKAGDLHVEQVDLLRDLDVWAHRIGAAGSGRAHTGPARLEIAGRPEAAAEGWLRLACPYDAAVALLAAADEEPLADAVARLDALGAVATARLGRRRMRLLGARSVPPEPRAATRAHPRHLTNREQEVLALMATGLRNQDIADRLFVSPKTVAVHLTSIYRKLGVLGRGEAAAWARAHADLWDET